MQGGYGDPFLRTVILGGKAARLKSVYLLPPISGLLALRRRGRIKRVIRGWVGIRLIEAYKPAAAWPAGSRQRPFPYLLKNLCKQPFHSIKKPEINWLTQVVPGVFA